VILNNSLFIIKRSFQRLPHSLLYRFMCICAYSRSFNVYFFIGRLWSCMHNHDCVHSTDSLHRFMCTYTLQNHKNITKKRCASAVYEMQVGVTNSYCRNLLHQKLWRLQQWNSGRQAPLSQYAKTYDSKQTNFHVICSLIFKTMVSTIAQALLLFTAYAIDTFITHQFCTARQMMSENIFDRFLKCGRFRSFSWNTQWEPSKLTTT
jgi:hypothetical protein